MTGNLIVDAMEYVRYIGPLLTVIGAVSLSDILITFLINIFKKMPFAKMVEDE